MGLQRFERRLERLVEGGFGKAFRSGLQPVEIGRRLVREMDIGRTLGVRGTVAPNDFTIRVAEADLERFDGFRESLVDELGDTAREHARESKYHFVGPVSVAFAVDPNARDRRPRGRRRHRRRARGCTRRPRARRRPPGAAGRGCRSDRPPPRLRGPALRFSGVPASRRGAPDRSRFRNRRPRLVERHDRQRRRRSTRRCSKTAT